MERVILLTGFGPFGGERINPSWEVAERFEGKRIGGAVAKSLDVREGAMPIPMRPSPSCSKSGRPCESRFQVVPPSADL